MRMSKSGFCEVVQFSDEVVQINDEVVQINDGVVQINDKWCNSVTR